MKRGLILSFIATIALAIPSCVKDKKNYSSDDQINNWVKENIIEIQKMTRAEFMKVDISRRQAAYNAFTPEQRISFWNDKISELLLRNWNDAEMEHIKLLQFMINNVSLAKFNQNKVN